MKLPLIWEECAMICFLVFGRRYTYVFDGSSLLNYIQTLIWVCYHNWVKFYLIVFGMWISTSLSGFPMFDCKSYNGHSTTNSGSNLRRKSLFIWGIHNKEALSARWGFSSTLQEKLFTILSHYGCSVCPSTTDLKSELRNVAKYEFQTKPLAALYGIGSGIHLKDKSFWTFFSIKEFHSLYLSFSAIAAKVLSIFDEPITENPC